MSHDEVCTSTSRKARDKHTNKQIPVHEKKHTYRQSKNRGNLFSPSNFLFFYFCFYDTLESKKRQFPTYIQYLDLLEASLWNCLFFDLVLTNSILTCNTNSIY